MPVPRGCHGGRSTAAPSSGMFTGRRRAGSTASTGFPSPRTSTTTISAPSTRGSWPSSPRAPAAAPSSSSRWSRLAGSSRTIPKFVVTREMCWTSSGIPSLRTLSPPAPRTPRTGIPGAGVGTRLRTPFQVRIWEIPEGGLKRNMTEAVLELYGHSRRVGLVEWHPTTNNILFSAGYDYKVLIWNLDIGEPVKMIDCHTDVILCMSFNTDGSLLATTCKDKKLRVVEPRSGRVLQEASCKNHRVNRVVFLGSTKRLLTTGVSRWNTRQIALWDQEDLSMPLIEEEIDGLSGLLFPFYDADTHMLYLAGKGDGNIRYYEIGSEKPYLSYLMEFRSPAPQKGLGVMPKHGLDVSACEVFRFYKLITLKGLIEPISMIVPRRSETYQEDIYPMTPGTEPALTPDEWLSGVNRDPILVSLKEGYKRNSKIVFKAPVREKKSVVVNGIDLLENVPPRTENELLRMFFRQQDEIRRLKDELSQKDIRIRQLQLELKNFRNSPKNN
ncbi:coronin-2B isoform X1 [Agelaius phoeniceus]|uniref:coronin-2B isoform X1 n=1 Tax=Agelaius phoeniceus TaxID=39638 RepID=UPI004054DEB1